jgi:hypothetical protein
MLIVFISGRTGCRNGPEFRSTSRGAPDPCRLFRGTRAGVPVVPGKTRRRPLADDAGKWGRRGGVQALWHAAGDVSFAAGGGGFAHGFGH